MADQLKRLRSAVVDGRAQTPRFIQNQLSKLHEALRRNQQNIYAAIRKDGDYSSAEADVEYFATVKAVRDSYESITLDGFIEKEYSLKNAKDNTSRRVAVGIVYIISSQHNRFYSLIQPLAAAIAAGNCVMIEIGQTTAELGTLLRKILSETLDTDTFAVVNSKPDDSKLFNRRVVVVDGRADSAEHSAFRVLSSTNSRSVAVVDRSSNVSEAAKAIVRARFAFRGRSPYSPDLVLVNEFVLQEFCTVAARCATEQVGANLPDGNYLKSKVSSNGSISKDIQQAGSTTLISGSRGSVVLVHKRNSSLLSKKVSEPVLIIHAIRSLDDAIDFTNSSSSSALASYIFAASHETKYLSQFIDSRVSFINHIPVDLLIGPATPSAYATTLQPRYTAEMFSNPHPEHLTPPTANALLSTFLDTSDKDSRSKITADVATALTPMNEPAGKQIGFFEQGLITGGLIGLTTVATVLGVTASYAVPAVLKRIR